MNNFDWESFLRRWSQEILDSADCDREALPVETIESGWLGYSGATDAQIAQAEARLGITLPPSYRAFLKVTNGWQHATHATLFISKFWSTEEIEWFNIRHPEWYNALLEKFGHPNDESFVDSPLPSVPDDEYFVYGEDQDCSKIRVEYLQKVLEISPPGDAAIYLLNPQVVTEEGEWEAWFLGDWLPGADRYRSFQDLMQAEYESFLELRETSVRSVTEPLDKNQSQDNLPETLPEIGAASDTIPDTTTPASDLDEEWNKLASFTVEVQAKHQAEHLERRLIVRHIEAGTVATHSNTDTATVQQWIAARLKEMTQPNKSPVGLEVTQLRIIYSTMSGTVRSNTSMIVDQANPIFSEAIRTGEPFSLEVLMKVTGSAEAVLAQQPLTYRTQCLAYHLPTQMTICLGDVMIQTQHINQPTSQPTYTAVFPELTLQKPGIYRLKVWGMIQNSSAPPGFFKVPMLQVV